MSNERIYSLGCDISIWAYLQEFGCGIATTLFAIGFAGSEMSVRLRWLIDRLEKIAQADVFAVLHEND